LTHKGAEGPIRSAARRDYLKNLPSKGFGLILRDGGFAASSG